MDYSKMNLTSTIKTLLKDGLVLVFNQDSLDVVRTAQALINAGLNNMEITCRIKKPLEKLQTLQKEMPRFIAGIASLIDYAPMLEAYNKADPDDPLPSVDQAADAGAAYLVSAANFTDHTYETFGRSIPLIPGCGSVTEILAQFSKGANLCKVFPAQQLGGPAFIKAIDPAIHKTISLVPTGGTNPGNFGDYIAAGVLVLGGSFSMIEKAAMQKIIDDQDYNLLAQELKKVKQLIDKLRAERWPGIDFEKASVEQISRATGRNFNLD